MFFGNVDTHLSVYKLSDLENSCLINVGKLKNKQCHSPFRMWSACFRLSCVPWKEKSIWSLHVDYLNNSHFTVCLSTSHCTTHRKVVGLIPDDVTWVFHWYSFRPHNNPGVDSASNRNEYHEYFQRGKGGRSLVLTILPPSCAGCLEIWEPQPSGFLRDCNRSVKGLLLYLYQTISFP